MHIAVVGERERERERERDRQTNKKRRGEFIHQVIQRKNMNG